MSNFHFHFVTLESLVVCWCGVSMERNSKLKGPSSPPSCSVDRSTIKLLPLTLTLTTAAAADWMHKLQICCTSIGTQAVDLLHVN